MKNNIIVVPIETKVREFFPKLYLACKIVAGSKFKVFIGGQRFLTKEISPKNCVWFDKFTYVESRSDAPFHINNKVIMQDEEGPISYNDISTVKNRYSIMQKKYLDHFLFSGEKDLKMIKYLKLKKNITQIFGLLKLELTKKKNSIFFKEEITKINKKYKNFLFVPGHSSSYRSKKQSQFIYKEKVFKHALKNNENVEKNYYRLIELCKKIATSNPKLTIVFRRHPNENENNLKSAFGDIPKNIKFVYKFSVTPWIIACKYYLHSGCQTSLEAIALKKKIITYLPNKVLTNNFKFTEPYFMEEEECLSFINKSRDNKKFYKINKMVEKIAINLKKDISYDSLFIKFLKKNYGKNLNSNLRKRIIKNQNLLKIFIFNFLSKLKTFLVNRQIYFKIIPKKYYIPKEIKEKKFKSIKFNEINGFINKFNHLYKTKLKAKTLSESTFLISK